MEHCNLKTIFFMENYTDLYCTNFLILQVCLLFQPPSFIKKKLLSNYIYFCKVLAKNHEYHALQISYANQFYLSEENVLTTACWYVQLTSTSELNAKKYLVRRHGFYLEVSGSKFLGKARSSENI